MKISKHLQVIKKEDCALCFHSLLGNLFILESSYLSKLESFKIPRQLNEKERNSKVIKEFSDAYYIIEDNTDEKVIMKNRNEKWLQSTLSGGRVFLLNLTISENCNIACPHCLHKCSVNTNKTHGNKSFMDWNTAKKSIDLFVKLMNQWNKEIYHINFGSAEPLMNWEVLKKSVSYIKEVNPNAGLSVNTNLLLLNIEKAKFFRDNNVFISTSLDGPKERNDLIRTYADKKGTYDILLKNFKILSDIGYPINGFSITINDLNFDYINENFIEWAANEGFKDIASDVDLINTLNSSKTIDDCVKKLVNLRDSCLKYNIANFGSWTTAYHNLVNDTENEMPTFCKAVKGNNISINPEGKIFICGHTTTVLGDINNFKDIFSLNSPYYKLIEKRLPGNNVDCYGCYIEGVCSGQCQITNEVAQTTKNNRDRFLCDLYHKATYDLLQKKLELELKEINNSNL